MKTIALLAALTAAAALCCPAPVSAHSLSLEARRGVVADDPPEGFQPRQSAATGVLCVKQCPNDTLPCDPPSYKIADGRCTTQGH